MHAVPDARAVSTRTSGPHEWVGAAVVGLGQGDTRRAEHAARTGRHVLNAATRIEVLEVYCHRCRMGYSARAERSACAAVVTRAG